MSDARAMERNVRLYPAFVAAANVLPWLPVFFLYFDERVGFDGALTLGAVYYAAVVLVEVPSGYLSDRIGRRPTLALAAAALLAAYGGFVVADGVAALVLCQALLATGIACQSGSDSALLHDSLAALGRTDEYERAEARARVVAMVALGLSCLVGGGLGSVDLVWPYALAAVAAGVALQLALRFEEPPVARAAPVDAEGAGDDAPAAPDSIGSVHGATADAETIETKGSLHDGRSTNAVDGGGRAARVVRPADTVLRGLADPVLRWLLLWYVLAFSLAHVPYEFQQPWIRLLGESGGIGAWLAGGDRTPMVSGIVAAASMFGGALGATVSVRLSARLGLRALLLLANAVQILIIGALAVALHPLLLVLVFARGLGMSMAHAPLLAAIAPRVASARRATWLSLQSLAGRLGFSLALFALAGRVDASLDWPTLSRVLLVCAAAGTALALAVAWLGHRQRTGSR